MKNRGTIVVAAVVVLLGGYLAWNLRSETKETESKSRGSLLFAFNPDQVNEFAIENAKGKMRLTRSVDGWKIEEPFQDQADDGFTDDFVDRSIKDHSLEVAKEGDGIDWKVYGLDNPAGKITFKTQAGASRTIEVSPKQNFEQNSIVRFTGENRVLIVPAAWSVSAARTVLEFRDKRLYRHKMAGVERIEVKNSNGTFLLERNDGKWTAVGHPSWVLDQNRVRELLSMVGETKVADFLPEADAKTKKTLDQLGLSKPVATIHLISGEKAWTASFGRGGSQKEKNDHAILSEPPTLLKLEPSSIPKFEAMAIDNLRDKKAPFDFTKGVVKKIDVETPLKKSAFDKAGSSWVLKDGGEVEADNGKVEELIDRLRGFQAMSFADASTSTKFKPINKIVLSDGEKEVFTVSWGLPFKTKVGENDVTSVAMKTSKSDDVFLVEDATMALLPLPLLVKAKGAPPAASKEPDLPQPPPPPTEPKVNQ